MATREDTAGAPLELKEAASVRPRPSRHPVARLLRSALRRPAGLVGAVVLVVLVLAAVFAPLIAPFDPLQQHPDAELVPPDARFLLGTDEYGRDILSRVIVGARASLITAGLAVVLGAAVGISSGLLAGYFGGAADSIIMRIYDGLMAFPAILLGLAVVAALGPGLLKVAIAIAIAQAPLFARLTRALALGEREREYVEAAQVMGSHPARVMYLHILPNSAGPLIVQSALAMAFAVLAEAALSFLGLGAQPPQPSWGNMLSDSLQFLRDAPWYGICPGVALSLLLIGLNLFSDALRDSFDPTGAGGGVPR